MSTMLSQTFFKLHRSRDSVVGTATGYGLDDQGVGVRVPVGSRIFTSPRRPDRHWGPPSLLSNGYRRLVPLGQSGSVKLTTHLQLVPKSRKCGSLHPLHWAHSAATCSRWFLVRGFFYLKMEAIRSSETSVQFTGSTRRQIPEDGILHSHRCENLRSYIPKYNTDNITFARLEVHSIEM
jgi:hypothetical protein